MARSRITAMIGGLVVVGAIPTVLNAFKITNPWIVGGAALVAALALVAAGMWQERFKRLTQRRDEQRFKIADGLLTLRSGRVPKVRKMADPLRLGVHPSTPIYRSAPEAEGVIGDRVPAYVPRDVDTELAIQLRAGGFVVLVGDSTAGKSRTAFETARTELPTHDLFVPGDKNIPKDVMAAVVEQVIQAKKAVLWLDDLEHYLRSGAITTVQISRIRDSKGHKVILATLRSAEEDQLIQVPADAEDRKRTLGDEAIQVLSQAHKIRLRRLFSPDELARARAHTSDERIADALEYSDEYGMAEYLAAGPHLQDAYENAWEVGRNPRGAALVAAAIDCRRAGYLSALPKELLEELHQIHLDSRGGKRLRPEPLEQAWEWATRQRRSTAALLQPANSMEARVEVFDYLVDQHQQQTGPASKVPDDIVRIIYRHANTPDIDAIAEHMLNQGRYQLAADGFTKAVWIHGASKGDEHPDTLRSRAYLADVLVDLGRWKEAKAESLAVLAARRRVLGEEHPETLNSRSSYATLLQALGRWMEAEREHRAVLEARRIALGEKHRHTLVSRNNLGVILQDLGRWEEAEQELLLELRSVQEVLGAEHPDTLVSRTNIAYLRAQRSVWQDQETRAETLSEVQSELEAILNIQRQSEGDEHPDTLRIRRYLAIVSAKLGLQEAAAAEMGTILAIWKHVQGEEHPAPLQTRNELGLILWSAGRLEEAEIEFRLALQGQRRVLGEGHPNTLASWSNLATVLRDQGRLREAHGELVQAVQVAFAALGDQHIQTQRILANLALLLIRMGQWGNVTDQPEG
ncbi:tetratricopeptide repeat protein [Microbispora sp. NPDC088329]|uniref:tetratricopeptide repeat protein n=1 Tax=Microbispora sp. NPDC088329 TaxID=3154869 RepID=UPI003438223E